MNALAFNAILGAASAAAAAILAIAWIVSACARSISNQNLPSPDRRLVARYNLLYMTIAFLVIGAILTVAARSIDQRDPPQPMQSTSESRLRETAPGDAVNYRESTQ